MASFSTLFVAGYHRSIVHFVQALLTKSSSLRQTTADQCYHDAIRARTALFATRAPTRAANASSRTGKG